MFLAVRSIVHCVLVLFVMLVVPAASVAQSDAAAGDGAQQSAVAQHKSDQTSKKADEWDIRWNPRPTVRLGAGTRIDFHLRYQFDQRESSKGVAEGADWSRDLEKRRFGIGGRIANVFDFKVERELAGSNPWRDVFVNYVGFKAVQLQGGQFKLPVGLDENTGVTNLDFVYRSLAANQLSPGRDRGVMVRGRALNHIVRYELGVFDHDGRNARTGNPERVFGGRTLAARVTAQPFRSMHSIASDVQVGVALTSSDVPLGLSSLRGESVLGEVVYTPRQYVQGLRRRTAFEARWRPGPFSLKSEYIRVTTERLGQSVEDTDLPSLLATAWYISGTWAVTGDRKAHGLDTPRRPLFYGGVGAIELAMRLEKVAFGSASSGETPSNGPRAAVVAGGADRATTVGVNWYVNRWVKLQWNVIHENITTPAETSSETRTWSRVWRVQFAF